MKLNADCIREVLLELEDSLVIYTNDEGNLENKTVSLHHLECVLIRYSREDIFYTLTNLEQAGYIQMIAQWSGSGLYRCEVKCITFRGHEFLEKIRCDQSWSKVKSVAESVRNYSLDAINQIANGVASAAITAYLEKVVGSN